MALLLLLVIRRAVTEAHAHVAQPDEVNREIRESRERIGFKAKK
jgi:hypothetical protein